MKNKTKKSKIKSKKILAFSVLRKNNKNKKKIRHNNNNCKKAKIKAPSKYSSKNNYEKIQEATIEEIIKEFEIVTEFSDKSYKIVANNDKPVSQADIEGRKDYRNLFTFTIDGANSKDFDDAISIEKIDGEYKLYVHIADVSNYVQLDSALDRDACKRGTSVYLVDRVLPMLPFRLSNGICSLNEGEERLTLSCEMNIDKFGNISKYEINEGVIVSDRRLTYDYVDKLLFDEVDNLDSKLKDILQDLKELTDILGQRRLEQGKLNFVTYEPKFILDEKGKVLSICREEHLESQKIIEECMLIANETVEKHFYSKQIPFLYRVHESPDSEKYEKLINTLKFYDISFAKAKENVKPKDIQELIEKVSNDENATLLNKIILRSQMQAKYSEKCSIHFGLASEVYTHFTSPIRRYPDLMIHRIIHDEIRGRLNEKKLEKYRDILPEVALKSSYMERQAIKLERAVNKLKMAEYISNYIGEEFDGIISGVTEFGFYVELENLVEGMVHVKTLKNDNYEYNEIGNLLKGKNSGIIFKLADKVRIKVKSVNTLTRYIDFEWVDTDEK